MDGRDENGAVYSVFPSVCIVSGTFLFLQSHQFPDQPVTHFDTAYQDEHVKN